MSDSWWRTGYAKQFAGDVMRIANAIERIASALEDVLPQRPSEAQRIHDQKRRETEDAHEGDSPA